MGLTTDRLLVGRLDGSVAYIDIMDNSTFRRQELDHCYRQDGFTRFFPFYEILDFESAYVILKISMNQNILIEYM